MAVKYVFKIKQWNDFIDLDDVVSYYNGEEVAFDEIEIPYGRVHDFAEHLKKFAEVEYQIIGVRDIPVDEDNMVIDGTHKDFDKKDWKWNSSFVENVWTWECSKTTNVICVEMNKLFYPFITMMNIGDLR